ncbi:hypothetical protein ACLB1R_28790 [Escherichia coli]
MTPEHLPTEQYEAQLAEKVVRLQSMMAPFSDLVPEVFRSPVSHYRMRAEFRIWHDGDDLYHIIFDQQTKSRIRVDSFPAASELINQLMTAMIAGVRNNPVLRHKLFQIDYLTTLSNQAVVSLLYHKKLDDEWRQEAEALRDALRAQNLNVHLMVGQRKPKSRWIKITSTNVCRSQGRDDLPSGRKQLYPAERGDEYSDAGMGAGRNQRLKRRFTGAVLRQR